MKAETESTAIALFSLNLGAVDIMFPKVQTKIKTERFVIIDGSLGQKISAVTLVTF
jgi:hypothetical protein